MDKIASFKSERATNYMAVLCKHFSHKVETSHNETNGWVKFPFGRCDMTVEDNELTLRAHGTDQDRLEQVVRIVTSHLDRFAFRENPELRWRAVSAEQ